MIITTERLVLRPLTVHDVDALVELDSEVMAFLTAGGRATPVAEAEGLVRDLLRHRHDHPGFGRWIGRHADSEERVGWFSVMFLPDRQGEVALGYRLSRRFWGRGLASEGSRAMLAVAFDTLEVERVSAETMAVNTRSRAVMERLGMTHARTLHPHFDDPIPGTEHGEVEYVITRGEYDRRRTKGSARGTTPAVPPADTMEP